VEVEILMLFLAPYHLKKWREFLEYPFTLELKDITYDALLAAIKRSGN
jgi:hypothetical protein